MRDDLGPLLNRSGHSIQMESERALWHTFAGGQINHTLKYGIELQSDWKVIADNFRVKIEGDGLTFKRIQSIIDTMVEETFWNEPATWTKILQSLPEYRLSKFQQALPQAYSTEMVSDLKGMLRFLDTFLCCDAVAKAAIMAFPALVLWLPGLM